MRTWRLHIFSSILAAVLAGAAWWYNAAWVAPLARRNEELAERKAGLLRVLEHARLTEQRAIEVETKTDEGRAVLQRRLRPYPEESAQVWIPDVVRAHFEHCGYPVGVVRSNTVLDEKALPGFRRAYWAIGIPIEGGEAKVPGLLLAVAELEEQHRIVQVLDFEIRPDVVDPARLEAVMNIEALVRE